MACSTGGDFGSCRDSRDWDLCANCELELGAYGLRESSDRLQVNEKMVGLEELESSTSTVSK
jgi:hypothetical protein